MSGRTHGRLWACLVPLFLAGCDSGPARVPQPSLDPQASGEQALEEYDSNHDGAIAGPELENCPGLKAGLPVIDLDKDGRVTAAEIAGRVQAYIDDRTALMTLSGRITLNGRPLVGALVTLVPEKFMGPAVKPAQGTTDASGYCLPSIEGDGPSGAHCGIYRIQISKPGADGKETLPSRYNSQSILGADVGVQSPSLYDGLTLSLKSP